VAPISTLVPETVLSGAGAVIETVGGVESLRTVTLLDAEVATKPAVFVACADRA
jgi:hypothetical protein